MNYLPPKYEYVEDKTYNLRKEVPNWRVRFWQELIHQNAYGNQKHQGGEHAHIGIWPAVFVKEVGEVHCLIFGRVISRVIDDFSVIHILFAHFRILDITIEMCYIVKI